MSWDIFREYTCLYPKSCSSVPKRGCCWFSTVLAGSGAGNIASNAFLHSDSSIGADCRMRSAFTGSFARTSSSEGGAAGAGGLGGGGGGDMWPASSLRWVGVRFSTMCVCSHVRLLFEGLTVSKVRCHSAWLTDAPRRISRALIGSCEMIALTEGGFGTSITGLNFSTSCLRSVSASWSRYADSQDVPAGAIFPTSCSRSRAASPPASHPIKKLRIAAPQLDVRRKVRPSYE
mmetsp:Transcript_39073/g.85014  ORF Transcript_39073/g.85014 Transcript_39073/m.85014 type:complete len:232 (-) Transcript_39073:7-702(-)